MRGNRYIGYPRIRVLGTTTRYNVRNVRFNYNHEGCKRLNTTTVDWFNVKDPHPMALTNLQRVVDYMIAEGAIHRLHTLSLYNIAKAMDKHQKQITQLIRDRPGFVLVEQNGKSGGYYYDFNNFGGTYPSNYRDLRRTRVLAIEDLTESVHKDTVEAVKVTKQVMEENIARLAKPAVDYPTVELATYHEEGPSKTIAITYVEVAEPEKRFFKLIDDLATAPPEVDRTKLLNLMLNSAMTILAKEHRKSKEEANGIQ